MQKRIRINQPLREVPRLQRRPAGKALKCYADRYKARDKAMAEAYRSGTYSMREIGDYFGVSRMTASRAVSKQERS